MHWAWTLGSVTLVSLISLIGAFTISMSHKRINKWLLYLVALAAGTLVGDALLHLLPHNASEFGFSVVTGALVLLGILIVFIAERFIHWHHCHEPHVCDDPHDKKADHSAHIHPFGWTILLGDGLHNLLDGALVAAAYLVSVPVGIATTLAVILHEIPQEIADFGVLLHAGFSRGRALMVNFASGLTAIVGAGLVLALNTAVEALEMYLVPLTAGVFIYIAVADLLPELEREERTKAMLAQFGTFLMGIAVMAALLLLE